MRKLSCFIKVDLRASSALAYGTLVVPRLEQGRALYYPYREERGMPNSLARFSLANELHQNFVLERFCEEGEGPGIQCGLADGWIVPPSNENNPCLG